MRRFSALSATLAALAATLLGCPNTDPAVFVDAGIEGASVSLSPQALGVSLSGGFRLRLHLGARAAGPSEVSFGSFALQSADQSETFVPALPLEASQPSPVDVEPDETIFVEFTIGTGAGLLDAALVDRICAGQVVVSGVVEDSLRGASATAVSAPVTPSGCP